MASSLSPSAPLGRLLHRPPEPRRSPAPVPVPLPFRWLEHPGRKGSSSLSAAVAGGSKNNKRYKGTAMREALLSGLIERKVAEAKEACGGAGSAAQDSDGCRVAWDEVEEVSRAKADLLRRRAESGGADPLEPFCSHNPESDECVVVDDED